MRAAEAANNTFGLVEGAVGRIKHQSEVVEKTDKGFQHLAISLAKAGRISRRDCRSIPSNGLRELAGLAGLQTKWTRWSSEIPQTHRSLLQPRRR